MYGIDGDVDSLCIRKTKLDLHVEFMLMSAQIIY